MKSAAMDIADVLVDAGLGTFAGTDENSWGIYVSQEPIQPSMVVTCYDTGGEDANPAYLLDFPTIQTRIRGKKDSYQSTYTKAWSVREALLGIDPFTTAGGTRYDGVWMTSDIVYLGLDLDRPIFVINWRIAREPSSGTYRTSL